MIRRNAGRADRKWAKILAESPQTEGGWRGNSYEDEVDEALFDERSPQKGWAAGAEDFPDR